MTKKIKDKVLCIYHANCADGFTAAWVVNRAFKDSAVTLYAAQYGSEPPLEEVLQYSHVVIVDFSYPFQQMYDLIQSTYAHAKVTVLDHHKTAEAALAQLVEEYKDSDLVTIKFDMEKSGAGMAWDYFFPDKQRPPLVDYVEDRDLWRFNLPKCREIMAFVFNHDQTLANWDNLHSELLTSEGSIAACEIGTHLLRKHLKDIDRLIEIGQTTETIGGVEVPCANMPPLFASEAGNKMCVGQPFSATYYINKEGEKLYSLRSDANGLDVSEIAKQYGGGGHARAAGFKVLA